MLSQPRREETVTAKISLIITTIKVCFVYWLLNFTAKKHVAVATGSMLHVSKTPCANYPTYPDIDNSNIFGLTFSPFDNSVDKFDNFSRLGADRMTASQHTHVQLIPCGGIWSWAPRDLNNIGLTPSLCVSLSDEGQCVFNSLSGLPFTTHGSGFSAGCCQVTLIIDYPLSLPLFLLALRGAVDLWCDSSSTVVSLCSSVCPALLKYCSHRSISVG